MFAEPRKIVRAEIERVEPVAVKRKLDACIARAIDRIQRVVEAELGQSRCAVGEMDCAHESVRRSGADWNLKGREQP